MFGDFCCSRVGLGARVCGAVVRIPAGEVTATVEGNEVLTVCRTVALLPVAAVPGVTLGPVGVTVTVFKGSARLTGWSGARVTPTAGAVDTALVCTGGLVSVTVGTLLPVDWDEITGQLETFCGHVAVGAAGTSAETGPLLTSATAGCEVLLPPPDASLGT